VQERSITTMANAIDNIIKLFFNFMISSLNNNQPSGF
jgi:hypothetical protein